MHTTTWYLSKSWWIRWMKLHHHSSYRSSGRCYHTQFWSAWNQNPNDIINVEPSTPNKTPIYWVVHFGSCRINGMFWPSSSPSVVPSSLILPSICLEFGRVVVYLIYIKVSQPGNLEYGIEICSLATTHLGNQATKFIITKFSTSIRIILVEECLNFLVAEDTPKLGQGLRVLTNIDCALVSHIKIVKGLTDGLTFVVLGDSFLSDLLEKSSFQLSQTLWRDIITSRSDAPSGYDNL